MRTNTYAEYLRQQDARREAISLNRSRRMRGLAPVAVPDKPDPPLVPVAYEADGTFYGRLRDAGECPDGCVVRWEPAQY